MDGCDTARRGLGGWLTIVAASIALSPLLSGCSSFSSSSVSSSGPEPGAASSSPPGSSAAPGPSPPSGTSAGIKQSFVGFLKIFRDQESEEAGAPAKIDAAQRQPGAPSSSSASSSAQRSGAASSSPSASSAALSSSSAAGTSVESLNQSLVDFLKAFRDLEPDERAPPKIGAAQPLPNPPSSATAVAPAGAPNSLGLPPAPPPQRPIAQ